MKILCVVEHGNAPSTRLRLRDCLDYYAALGVEATVGKPQVAYKETLTRPADGEMKYAKQTGGRGQYGHVKIHLFPGEPGSGQQRGVVAGKDRHRPRAGAPDRAWSRANW